MLFAVRGQGATAACTRLGQELGLLKKLYERQRGGARGEGGWRCAGCCRIAGGSVTRDKYDNSRIYLVACFLFLATGVAAGLIDESNARMASSTFRFVTRPKLRSVVVPVIVLAAASAILYSTEARLEAEITL